MYEATFQHAVVPHLQKSSSGKLSVKICIVCIQHSNFFLEKIGQRSVIATYKSIGCFHLHLGFVASLLITRYLGQRQRLLLD